MLKEEMQKVQEEKDVIVAIPTEVLMPLVKFVKKHPNEAKRLIRGLAKILPDNVSEVESLIDILTASSYDEIKDFLEPCLRFTRE